MCVLVKPGHKGIGCWGPQEREITFRRVSEVERKFGIRFPPGYNRRVRFMAHAHDPLRYIHKPLLVHASGELLRLLTSCALYSMGFSTGVHQVTALKLSSRVHCQHRGPLGDRP